MPPEDHTPRRATWRAGTRRSWRRALDFPAMRQVVGDVPLGGSPFPPIADYAFLSDCEACALVAPSGNVEWLCAAPLRLALDVRLHARPRRRAVPARAGRHDGARRPPLPAGHDGPGDHVGHADGLGHRPRRPADRALAPRQRPLAHAPALADGHGRRPRAAAHDALRQRATSRCTWSASRSSTTGASASTGSTTAQGYSSAVGRIDDDELTLHLTTDLRLGFEGGRARARSTLRDGDTAFVALSWSEHRAAATYDEAYHRLVFTADFWHEWLVARRVPRPPVAHLPAAQRADAQGPDLRADRRDGRGGDDVAAGDARRRAQLGLPLRVDPRLARSCSGASTRSGFDEEANDFFYFIRDVVTAERRTSCRSCTASAASAS